MVVNLLPYQQFKRTSREKDEVLDSMNDNDRVRKAWITYTPGRVILITLNSPVSRGSKIVHRSFPKQMASYNAKGQAM